MASRLTIDTRVAHSHSNKPHHQNHHHHHHGIDANTGDRRVMAAIAVNFLLTAAQIVGGLLSGSLALIADALHNFSDAISLVIAFGARRIARRPADAAMPFGYARAEVVAALVNYTTLIVLGLYLVYEAILRFLAPQPVDGWLVIAIAALALVVDVITALLTHALSRDSVNIRAAFLHNVADALGSLAVIVGGSLILVFGWTWIDPAITLMIAAYILYMAWLEVGNVIRILMLGSPPGLAADEVIDAVLGIDGVADLHNALLWMRAEHTCALDAHLVIDAGRWGDADAIKQRVKTLLHERFDITYTTLELECARHACVLPTRIGSNTAQLTG